MTSGPGLCYDRRCTKFGKCHNSGAAKAGTPCFLSTSSTPSKKHRSQSGRIQAFVVFGRKAKQYFKASRGNDGRMTHTKSRLGPKQHDRGAETKGCVPLYRSTAPNPWPTTALRTAHPNPTHTHDTSHTTCRAKVEGVCWNRNWVSVDWRPLTP